MIIAFQSEVQDMKVTFGITDDEHNTADAVTAEQFQKAYDAYRQTYVPNVLVSFSKDGTGLELTLIDDINYTSEETVEDETERVLAPAWPEIKKMITDEYGEDDEIAINEGFNDWTDSLCKDGDISERTYNEVTREDVERIALR